MAETVAAVVVTFNRKVLLGECLEALLNQTRPVDKVILIDNASTDGTPEFLSEHGYLHNDLIDFVRLPENTGGSGGFYEGVKRGYEAGYDWLWLMDDDAEPDLSALEKMVLHFHADEVVAVANLKVGEDGNPQYQHLGWFNFCRSRVIVTPISEENINETDEVDHSSFVGTAIRMNTVRDIGYPKKEFFIHLDDVEYCIRLRTRGKIILAKDSVIVHKDGRNERNNTVTVLKRTSKRASISKIWLTYFGIRNEIWLRTEYVNRSSGYYFLVANAARMFLGIILYDSQKLSRIRFYLNAYIDGVLGRFDNHKPIKLANRLFRKDR